MPPPSQPSSPHRARIIAATADLVRDGDLGAVQMRVVAQRAGVALATLYRHFPSKANLLSAVLIEQITVDSHLPSSSSGEGGTPLARVLDHNRHRIRERQQAPLLHAALIRAIAADSGSSHLSVQIVELTQSTLAGLIEPKTPCSERTSAIAAVLADVWLTSSIGWASGWLSSQEVFERTERAARLLLGES